MSGKERQIFPESESQNPRLNLLKDPAQAKADALWEQYEAERKAGRAPEVPKDLDASCQELIRASQRKHRENQLRKYVGIGLKRAAIIALALIVLTSTLVMSVDAIRMPIINLFVAKGEKYSTVFFGATKVEDIPVSSEDKILSSPLPSGYQLISIQNRPDGSLCYQFENSDGAVLQVNIRSIDMTFNFDTEDAEQVPTTVNEWSAVYIQKHGHRVIWFDSDSNCAFDVYAEELSETEFWKYVNRLAK